MKVFLVLTLLVGGQWQEHRAEFPTLAECHAFLHAAGQARISGPRFFYHCERVQS